MGSFKRSKQKKLLKLRCIRLWSDLCKDAKDRLAQFTLLALFFIWGIAAIPAATTNVVILTIIVIVSYFFARVFLAHRNCLKDEDAKGKWVDQRFLYHSPKNIFTTQVHPDDLGKLILFQIDDVEPNTMVELKYERHGGLTLVNLVCPTMFDVTGQLGSCSHLRVDEKRQAGLHVYSSAPESDPTTIRVSILSWEWDDASRNDDSLKPS